MSNIDNNQRFERIALMGRRNSQQVSHTLEKLIQYLQHKGCTVVLEAETAAQIDTHDLPIIPQNQLSQESDLLIIVGGDGSLLRAARIAAPQNLPVLGIHRGRLGFLTDIHPEEMEKVGEVIDGRYQEESRFLITATATDQQHTLSQGDALNDVVLTRGDIIRMIEFDIYIDQQFVCNQRADGLIIATPTGSTAYALSGGGPILHPQIDAVVLVPMFAHTLSSRPIVLQGDTEITVFLGQQTETSIGISYDGQKRVPLSPGSRLSIKKNKNRLRLIHPTDYHYFDTLRTKMHWEQKNDHADTPTDT